MEETIVSIAGNTPFLLNDPEAVWFVRSGKADVFAVAVEDSRAVGRRTHIFQADMGQALFGLDTDKLDSNLGLLVCGSPGTQLVKRSKSGLLDVVKKTGDIMFAEPVMYLIESWIMGLSSGIVRNIPPVQFNTIQAGQNLTLTAGTSIRPWGEIVWLRQQEGSSRYVGQEDIILTADSGFYPLTEKTWIQSVGGATIEALATMDLVAEELNFNLVWNSLEHFHSIALRYLALNHSQAEYEEQLRLKQKAGQEADLLDRAFSYLATAAEGKTKHIDEGINDPLEIACHLVGEQMGITIKTPPVAARNISNSRIQLLNEIARASRVRIRQVLLRDEWWLKESGPILAFTGKDEEPVALLPAGGGYEMVDPCTGQKTRINHQTACLLQANAYVWYRSFPDRAMSLLDLLKFSLGNRWSGDFTMATLMGAAGGLLGLLLPLATGILFESIIPGSRYGQLGLIFLVLITSAGAALLFQIVRSLALLRVEGKMDLSIQAAVWDRLMSLPVAFYRQFTVGDLAVRANGINSIRVLLSQAAITTLFSSAFSFLNLILLFYYDASLAWAGLGLVILGIIITVRSSYRQIKLQRILTTIEGKISGLLLQTIQGIAKIRVSGAENRAFYRWAKEYSEQRRIALKSGLLANRLIVFNAVYPLLASMLVFSLLAYYRQDFISTGQFLAFNAAFTGLLTAILELSTVMANIWEIVPLYERAKPILTTLPEVDEAKTNPGELSGEIEISHVDFKYSADGPKVLHDVCLSIKPGEFIAVVGFSGSGKSTLLRLLLGFDHPETGAVFYDGQDLSGLDVRYVRSQIGVVMQNDRLMSGTIFHNIIGASNLTLEDAWEVAAMVGLDQDIAQMPMGMHTYVAEGGSTFSGGQQQRILIARALAKKPRIIIFDEATSALDNETQTVVSESLERLKVSRVVIAHRLSTIVNADRIYVMDQGRVVESGLYDELMDKNGLFAEMAKRQLA